MREIARTVDLPIATVYQYFPNKSAILRSLWIELYEECSQCVLSALEAVDKDCSEAEFRGAVSLAVLGVGRIFDERPEWAEVSRSILITPETRVETNGHVLAMAEECAGRLGQIRPDLTSERARLIMVITLQSARATLLFSLERPEEERAALREELVTQICASLLGP